MSGILDYKLVLDSYVNLRTDFVISQSVIKDKTQFVFIASLVEVVR